MSNIINGTDLFVFLDTNHPVGHATSHTLTISMETRQTSNKDSGAFKTRAEGRLDVTATCEGLMAYGSFEDIVTKEIARAPLLILFARKVGTTNTAATSGTYASGYFYVTNWEGTAPDAGNATYSVSFEHCSGFVFTSGAGA